MAKYKLLTGWHSGNGPSGPHHIYKANQPGNNIIESDVDLCARGGYDKFAKVDEGSITGPTDDGLESLTVSQLRDLAKEQNIDLGHSSRKDEIIHTIRNNMDNE